MAVLEQKYGLGWLWWSGGLSQCLGLGCGDFSGFHLGPQLLSSFFSQLEWLGDQSSCRFSTCLMGMIWDQTRE